MAVTEGSDLGYRKDSMTTRPRFPFRPALPAFALAMFGLLTMLAPAQAQSQTYTVLHNFSGGQDGSRPQATLAIDRAGNLYGTAPQGGTSDYGTVFKLTRYGSSFIFNPLYNFHGQSDGGAPFGPVTIAADGTLYGTTIEGGYFGGAYCSNGGCGRYGVSPHASAHHPSFSVHPVARDRTVRLSGGIRWHGSILAATDF